MGGEACKNPGDANFIIVDAQTDGGRQFIRDWASEKPILQYDFVKKCLDANAFLGPDTQPEPYGGCEALDDGFIYQSGEGNAHDAAPSGNVPQMYALSFLNLFHHSAD